MTNQIIEILRKVPECQKSNLEIEIEFFNSKFLSLNTTMIPSIEHTLQHYRFPLANYHRLAVHYLPPHPQGRPIRNE